MISFSDMTLHFVLCAFKKKRWRKGQRQKPGCKNCHTSGKFMFLWYTKKTHTWDERHFKGNPLYLGPLSSLWLENVYWCYCGGCDHRALLLRFLFYHLSVGETTFNHSLTLHSLSTRQIIKTFFTDRSFLLLLFSPCVWVCVWLCHHSKLWFWWMLGLLLQMLIY